MGVGISIGLSRILGKLFAENKIALGRKSPTDVLIVLPSEDRYKEASQTANVLRSRGFHVEVYPTYAKFAKQMKYASRKGIPYVWFLPFEEGGQHEVKNLETGEQMRVEAETWEG